MIRASLNKSPYIFVKKIYNLTLGQVGKLVYSSLHRPVAFNHMYRVQEIIMQQNRVDGYNRLDTIVRLLAIENEYGQNDYGWKLYQKMQSKRVQNEQLTTEERVENFKQLIHSWERNGYEIESTIVLDNNLMLVDGSHRLAMSIYHNLEEINCHVIPQTCDVKYGVEWFVENDFSSEEIDHILEKADSIIQKYKIHISCILWPPIKEYFDEIVKKISYMYNVIEVKDMLFSDDDFDDYVQSVYQIDDIAQWKIDRKKEYMKNSNEKTVRYILLEFENPLFRYKELNKNTIMTQGEELKRMIRNCYKDKIDNYFYDIICHTGDNHEQSEYMSSLIKNHLYKANSSYTINK